MAADAPQKALIVLLGAIGDVTRALPVAMRINRSWPDTELHWAVEPVSSSILENHPAIDKIHLFDRPKGFPAYLRFLRNLRREKFDLVLDMQRHLKSGFSSFATGAARRLCFNRSNSRECNWLFNTEQVAASPHFSSKTQQFQNFPDLLGLPAMEPLVFGLRPSETEQRDYETLLENLSKEQGISFVAADRRIVFILGSSWESRFWRAEYYARLAAELYREFALVPVLIGGKGERDFADSILRECGDIPVIDLVSKTTLRELVSVFNASVCAVGSDSGPMHIAAATGIPVVSLWGSTSPKRSAPYGSESYVLQSAIGCSPCYRKVCPGLNTLCMKDLSWQAVFAQIQGIISQRL